ncbi:MAG: YlxM family DNA-binding protein [Anaerovoracaceae bacterium]
MVDDITKASLLYDFYGALLTEKQRQVMALYHEENLSLSEIGQEFGISRQAVHDTLKKAEQALEEYEDKLKLMDKFLKTERALALIGEEIALLEEELRGGDSRGIRGDEQSSEIFTDESGSGRPLERLENIKAIIKDLEE